MKSIRFHFSLCIKIQSKGLIWSVNILWIYSEKCKHVFKDLLVLLFWHRSLYLYIYQTKLLLHFTHENNNMFNKKICFQQGLGNLANFHFYFILIYDLIVQLRLSLLSYFQLCFSNVKEYLQCGRNMKKCPISTHDFSLEFYAKHLINMHDFSF